MSISICSVNVRGIREYAKRRDVFQYVKSLGCVRYCLVDTHFTSDMLHRVRAEWGSEVVLSYGTGNSRGVAILTSPGAPVIIHSAVSDDGGNYVIINVEFDGYFRCNLVVLYGPNEDRPSFFRDLFKKVSDLENNQYPVIYVGDWNLVIDPEKDTKFYRSVGNISARRAVLNEIENESLVDIWREQHPNLRRYTWKKRNPTKYSRLDYFLVSPELLPYVASSDIRYGHRTDHNVVTLTFKNADSLKRNMYWKFNNSLLKDDAYLNQIKTEIIQVKYLYALPPYSKRTIEEDPDIQFAINDQLFFETLLCHLRGITIKYASRKKKSIALREKALIEALERLDNLASDDPHDIEEQEMRINELNQIRQDKMEGVLLRAKARWIEEGERPTKYFCGLEKRQYTKKYIQSWPKV